MTRLFLVRHGQTTSNQIHALDTALPGADLTELGREQARVAGQQLAVDTDRLHVLSSMAARAQQTAANIANSFAGQGRDLATSAPGSSFANQFAASFGVGLSSFPDATATRLAGPIAQLLAMLQGVSEIPAGDMEMKNDEDSHEAYHGMLGQWLHGDIETQVPGGLSGAHVLDQYIPQALAAGAAGVKEGTDVALISHGAVIRFVATWLGGVDPEFAYQAYLPNAQVVTLDLPSDLPQVLREIAESAGSAVGAGAADSADSADIAGDVREALRGRFTVTGWGEFGVPKTSR